MKAKEYAENYMKSDNKNDEIINIARSFLTEIDIMAKARNAKMDSALIPICRELNQKWITFATLVNKKLPISEPIKYTGFTDLVKTYSPELFILWLKPA
jgi:hypothetical protein